jgi:hypothetical protein
MSSVTLSASLGRGCSAASSPGRASSVASTTAFGGAGRCRFAAARVRHVLTCCRCRCDGAVCRSRAIYRPVTTARCTTDMAILPQCTCECHTCPSGRAPSCCNATEGTCETPAGCNLARSAGLECRCMAARLCYTRYAVPLCVRRQTNPCRTLRLGPETCSRYTLSQLGASHYAM